METLATKRYQEIVLNFPESINDPDFKFGKRGTDKYDKTMRYMRSYFDLCFEEWDLNDRNLIDNKTWEVWRGGIQTAMKKSAFRQAWTIAMNTGTDYKQSEFQNFIGVFVSQKNE